MKLSDFLKRTYDPKDRVMIFIDGSNLYHGLKSECGSANLDYLKFSDLLANKRKLIRTYFYTSTIDAKREPEKAKGQQRFLNALREIPYVTIKHRVLLYKADLTTPGTPPKPFEKGVDILIATDMLTNALRDCYDTAILVSGDGDFAPVLEEITRAGKQIENAVFSSSRSDALISASDLFIELNKYDLRSCFRS